MKKPSQQDISRIIPNTFPFPNYYIDSGIWALLKPQEQSCLVILARKTYGWWKQSDRIAMSQMSKLTGMADATVRKVMNRLVTFGLAICLSGSHDIGNPSGKEWSLQTDDQLVDFDALTNREIARGVINHKRTDKLKNATPHVRQIPSPNVPRKETPHVAHNPQYQSKPSNKKSTIPSKSQLIKDAFAKFWRLTLTPSWKSHLEFIKWAVSIDMTPAMIQFARNTFDNDPELNWKGKRNVSLPMIQENWLIFTEGFCEPSQQNKIPRKLTREDVVDLGGI